MSYAGTARTTALSAVVRAADGVRFVAVAETAEQLAEMVVDYVRERCEYVLWPGDAERVCTLIELGEFERAIAEYFWHVGARWDDERLDGAEFLTAAKPERRGIPNSAKARTARNS